MTDNSDNPIVSIDKHLIEEQAQRWFLRSNSGEMTAVEKAEHQHWLQADSMHRIAFQELQNLWDIVGSFAEAPEIVTARQEILRNTGAETKSDKQSLFSRPWTILAMAASLLLTVITAIQLGQGNFFSAPAPGDIYQTQVGERKTIVLSDGSRVLLDTNTRLVTDYSQQSRRIRLEKGQARFDVVQDKQRPFSVEAGEGVVTALGTTFVIRKTADDVLVTLIEGIVAVAREKQRITISHAPNDHEDIAQQLVYSKKGISKADIVDVPEVTSWQRGRLVFDNHSLPEVVAELNRYSDKKIIIADRSLRSIRVTGVFTAGDDHSAIKALKTYFSMSLGTDPQGNFILKSDAGLATASDKNIEGHL